VRGEITVTLDSDLQNDPADIPALLAALEGWDCVSGVRQSRQDAWQRRPSSRLANGVRSRVLGDGITDVGCSLKAYRSQLLRHVPMFQGMHRFLPALVLFQGGRVREIPVHHRPRRFGVAKYGIGNRLWRGLADLSAVAWMRRR
jgi:dolichol-phosphate mannosyltransferase